MQSLTRSDSITLPDELKSVPRAVLEDYVLGRLRQFSRVFASQLYPSATEQAVEFAYSRTLDVCGVNNVQETEPLCLKFRHRCRFLGCPRKECQMCKNNPNKHCDESDNFDDCYADNQILKSKCEADVYVEICNQVTGEPTRVPGLEIQVSVIDGESYNSSNPAVARSSVNELLTSDESQPLLGSYLSGTKSDAEGRIFLKFQDGRARLPDLFVSDKNDTFHKDGSTYNTFRLMARAVTRDLNGNPEPVPVVLSAISAKFVVKTQRALNDYRKSEYPHYKDELTKLKYIGSITSQRLREIQTHLGPDVPFTCVETVEQLKQLMEYADANRQVENKLLELLNMKGKHKHKWDYLREVLQERIVYDDMLHRAWYTDESMSQGLLFACKQGQVNMDKPIGLLQRVIQGAQSRLQVINNPDGHQMELMKHWRQYAENSWNQPSHPGWTIVAEPLELMHSCNVGGGMQTPGPGAVSSVTGPPVSPAMSPALSSMSGDAHDDAAFSGTSRPSNSAPSPMNLKSEGLSQDITGSGRRRRPSNAAHQMQTDAQGTSNSDPVAGSGLEFQFGAQSYDPMAQFMDGSNPLHEAALFAFARHQNSTPTGPSGLAGSPMSVPVSDLLLHDMYRTASAPTATGNSVQNFINSSESSGVSALMAAAAAQASILGAHRSRRLSAEMSPLSIQQSLGVPTRSYTPPESGSAPPPHALLQALGATKRVRASAPGELLHDNPIEESPLPPAAQSPFLSNPSLTRMALYHSESQGRHLPRNRSSLVEDPTRTVSYGNQDLSELYAHVPGSEYVPVARMDSTDGSQLVAQLQHNYSETLLSSLDKVLSFKDDPQLPGGRVLHHSGDDSFSRLLDKVLFSPSAENFAPEWHIDPKQEDTE